MSMCDVSVPGLTQCSVDRLAASFGTCCFWSTAMISLIFVLCVLLFAVFCWRRKVVLLQMAGVVFGVFSLRALADDLICVGLLLSVPGVLCMSVFLCVFVACWLLFNPCASCVLGGRHPAVDAQVHPVCLQQGFLTFFSKSPLFSEPIIHSPPQN